MSREYLSVADTAKLVRTALKNAFPGTKFSVRSDSYAGGASIRVKWTDGPTTADVNVVIKMYEGGGFDGMQDLAYSYSHWLLPDGTTLIASSGHNLDGGERNPKPHPDAVRVHFGADYVFADRTLSAAFMHNVAAHALSAYDLGSAGIELTCAANLVDESKYGPRWNPAYANKWAGSCWVSDLLNRAAARMRGDGTLTHDANGHDLSPESM